VAYIHHGIAEESGRKSFALQRVREDDSDSMCPLLLIPELLSGAHSFVKVRGGVGCIGVSPAFPCFLPPQL